MTTEERNLINGLFDRLHTADSATKDREAEQLIQQKVATQPGAPYLMAQTVLVQEQALSNAQARIKDLETRLTEASKAQPQEGSSGGSFLSGLFGGAKHTPSLLHREMPPRPLPRRNRRPAGMLQRVDTRPAILLHLPRRQRVAAFYARPWRRRQVSLADRCSIKV